MKEDWEDEYEDEYYGINYTDITNAVMRDGMNLKFASPELRDDFYLVLYAVRQNGYALKYASKELRGDKEVVLVAVKKDGCALKYASKELRGDKEVVLEAVKEDGIALAYASKELRGDKEVVLEAVCPVGIVLQYASEELRGDKEVVLKAVKCMGSALQYARKELREDEEFMLNAIKENEKALEYAYYELKEDKEFIKKANLVIEEKKKNSEIKKNEDINLAENKLNTIDIEQLGAEIGMEAKEQTLPNGKVVKSLVWDKENLLKAVNEVKHLSEEGNSVKITGAAPAWLVSALTHTVHPCPVSVYVPQIGKDVNIPQLAHGKENKEGEVTFKTTEKGDAVLVEFNMNLPEGITTYDENNLSKVVVPEISQGKAVYISGRGPNYLTVAIAEAYAHTNSSVSLFQPGVGYTCSITHSRNKQLGDLAKDPIGMEEIKEQLAKSGEEQEQK